MADGDHHITIDHDTGNRSDHIEVSSATAHLFKADKALRSAGIEADNRTRTYLIPAGTSREVDVTPRRS
jgi:hypothetical protein